MNMRCDARTMAAVAGLGMMSISLVGCGQTTSGQMVGANQGAQSGAIAVNCGAGQQAMIRPSTINGQAVSQVECVPVAVAAVTAPPVAQSVSAPLDPAAGGYVQPAAVPVAYAPASAPVYAGSGGPVAARPAVVTTDDDYVEYRPAPPVRRPVRRVVDTGRSWKKSAVIIGSSAGIGAGIGAASGGKKGALIGAAMGGGASAIWDQVTRAKP